MFVERKWPSEREFFPHRSCDTPQSERECVYVWFGLVAATALWLPIVWAIVTFC